MTFPVKHLSTSSVNLYLACPAKWKLRYIDGVKTPTSPHLPFGTAFHDAVEAHIQAGEYGTKSLEDRWAPAWQKALSRAREDGGIDWGASSEQEFDSLGQRMLASPSIVRMVAGIKPLVTESGKVQIERYFSVDVEGSPVPFVGFIDVIEADGYPSDFKTSKSAWTRDAALKELQPALYMYAMQALGFQVPEGFFRHYVFTKDTLVGQRIEQRVTRMRIEEALRSVRQVVEGVLAGAFPWAGSGYRWCSPRYCEASDQCGRY
jgi:hypothetical protein